MYKVDRSESGLKHRHDSGLVVAVGAGQMWSGLCHCLYPGIYVLYKVDTSNSGLKHRQEWGPGCRRLTNAVQYVPYAQSPV